MSLPYVIAIDGLDGFRGRPSYYPLNGYDTRIIEIDTEGEMVDLCLNSFPPSNIANLVRQAIERSGCYWIAYEGAIQIGICPGLRFRVLPNTNSTAPRSVFIGCPSHAMNAVPGILIHQKGDDSGLERFSVSSTITTALYPGYRYTITLQDSEAGVDYALTRFDETIASLRGTGQKIEFTGDWGEGIFNIVATGVNKSSTRRHTLEIPW
jgi:hypothetical protein